MSAAHIHYPKDLLLTQLLRDIDWHVLSNRDVYFYQLFNVEIWLLVRSAEES